MLDLCLRKNHNKYTICSLAILLRNRKSIIQMPRIKLPLGSYLKEHIVTQIRPRLLYINILLNLLITEDVLSEIYRERSIVIKLLENFQTTIKK